MHAVEMARFRVDPARADEMQSRRVRAFEALQQQCPGLLSNQLIRLDERTWMDLVVWESRAAAEAAAREALTIPEAAAYFESLDEVVAMEHGEVVHASEH
jgi:heme-degrading monooxygenase HmoA